MAKNEVFMKLSQAVFATMRNKLSHKKEKITLQKKVFEISLHDAKLLCDGLELAASWDKTTIYYDLLRWIQETK